MIVFNSKISTQAEASIIDDCVKGKHNLHICLRDESITVFGMIPKLVAIRMEFEKDVKRYSRLGDSK